MLSFFLLLSSYLNTSSSYLYSPPFSFFNHFYYPSTSILRYWSIKMVTRYLSSISLFLPSFLLSLSSLPFLLPFFLLLTYFLPSPSLPSFLHFFSVNPISPFYTDTIFYTFFFFIFIDANLMKKRNDFWVHHFRICRLLGNHEMCSLPSILLIEFFSKVKLKIGIWTVRSR